VFILAIGGSVFWIVSLVVMMVLGLRAHQLCQRCGEPSERHGEWYLVQGRPICRRCLIQE
jgi:formylmethanofuran dehydrogenase subunit E